MQAASRIELPGRILHKGTPFNADFSVKTLKARAQTHAVFSFQKHWSEDSGIFHDQRKFAIQRIGCGKGHLEIACCRIKNAFSYLMVRKPRVAGKVKDVFKNARITCLPAKQRMRRSFGKIAKAFTCLRQAQIAALPGIAKERPGQAVHILVKTAEIQGPAMGPGVSGKRRDKTEIVPLFLHAGADPALHAAGFKGRTQVLLQNGMRADFQKIADTFFNSCTSRLMEHDGPANILPPVLGAKVSLCLPLYAGNKGDSGRLGRNALKGLQKFFANAFHGRTVKGVIQRQHAEEDAFFLERQTYGGKIFFTAAKGQGTRCIDAGNFHPIKMKVTTELGKFLRGKLGCGHFTHAACFALADTAIVDNAHRISQRQYATCPDSADLTHTVPKDHIRHNALFPEHGTQTHLNEKNQRLSDFRLLQCFTISALQKLQKVNGGKSIKKLGDFCDLVPKSRKRQEVLSHTDPVAAIAGKNKGRTPLPLRLTILKGGGFFPLGIGVQALGKTCGILAIGRKPKRQCFSCQRKLLAKGATGIRIFFQSVRDFAGHGTQGAFAFGRKKDFRQKMGAWRGLLWSLFKQHMTISSAKTKGIDAYARRRRI